MDSQDVYTTTVTLEIKIQHFKTHPPKQMVENIIFNLLNRSYILEANQVGERKTEPTWPYNGA